MKLKRFYKDIKKRNMFSLFEIVHNLFLVLKRWLFLKKKYLFIYILLQKANYFFKKNTFKCRIKNFCIISGRSKGVFRNFRVSRIMLRFFANSGNFFGLKKLSW